MSVIIADHELKLLNGTFLFSFIHQLYTKSTSAGLPLRFWIGRTYARGSIFGRMVRRGYWLSAFSYAKPSLPIFGVSLGLLKATKMY